jgi:hypothetical protein
MCYGCLQILYFIFYFFLKIDWELYTAQYLFKSSGVIRIAMAKLGKRHLALGISILPLGIGRLPRPEALPAWGVCRKLSCLHLACQSSAGTCVIVHHRQTSESSTNV